MTNNEQKTQNVSPLLPLVTESKDNSKSLFLELKNRKNTNVTACNSFNSTKEVIKEKEGVKGIEEVDNIKKHIYSNNNRNQSSYTVTFNPALMLLPFWSLLICLTNLAQSFNLAWASGLQKRITIRQLNSADIDWLIKAMAHTWQAIPETDKQHLLPEYETFRTLNAVYDWPEAYRVADDRARLGPEHSAFIRGAGYEKVRTVRAFSRDEAQAKIVGKNEMIIKWLN